MSDPFPAVYAELRRLAAAKLAREPAGHTLDATALVHEAYLRLGEESFGSRSGFFRAAAEAMRRILVDHARAKPAGKRGGGAGPGRRSVAPTHTPTSANVSPS
jgi:RNA polymerase sigma factor (TIGR02999 family)